MVMQDLSTQIALRATMGIVVLGYAASAVLFANDYDEAARLAAICNGSATAFLLGVVWLRARSPIVEERIGRHFIRGRRNQLNNVHRMLESEISVERFLFLRLLPSASMLALFSIATALAPLGFFVFRADARMLGLLLLGAMVQAALTTALTATSIAIQSGQCTIRVRSGSSVNTIQHINLEQSTMSCDLVRGIAHIAAPGSECLVELDAYDRPYSLCASLIRGAAGRMFSRNSA